ncbi:sensor histidine kinase [Reinekea blandensis]|uniref:Uncharacterized protein n=1 Tax=Reinekea blandensis MED297 TaxID=314283 RepID=A4BFL4_9GAMM|nr:sensor histidine kinase [Reinekea blandensis]EAR09109.1 hypothetical protein MED297_17243 [Reinekea sp. MED297] [Reinekea blandensis MED297]
MSPVMILLVSMAQQMSMFLVIAYLLSKTPLFLPLSNISARLPNGLIIYFIFSAFCILASLFGHTVNDAIANTRAVGAVLGGLLGGPFVGLAVGLTGGIHRFTLGGFTDVACAVSTTLEGLLGGLVHLWVRKQGHYESQLFSPKRALVVTFFAEMLQMALILLIARPFDQAWALVQQIALPMLLINSIGAAMFMMMIQDRRKLYNEFSSAGSDQALRLTERLVGVLGDRPDQASARRIADIIKEETQVAAVGITNETEVLAFVGLGDDHHKIGETITSEQTLQAIRENRVVFADGITTPYKCSHSHRCPLGSALVVPIRDADNTVIGTVKLYEGKRSLFQSINRSLGEGIGRIITEQLTISQHHEQKQLLSQAELKVARAQVNPHFLFNALNTINAVIKRSPETARSLVSDLSLFLRINLKRNQSVSTLAQELEHANAYLHIEQVRFADRLSIEQTVSDALLTQNLPTFTVQPLVENAIKHGTSQLLEGGQVRIYSRTEQGVAQLVVEDNAGRYSPTPGAESEGLGMNIVDTRLKHHFGSEFGLQVECEPERYTRVIVTLAGVPA